jgi:alkanesulfonate monooxygenase SsuD/methylene tetrahydromethanopterin reductase-like flavin-dependent oxidoreductase (luciferase family)
LFLLIDFYCSSRLRVQILPFMIYLRDTMKFGCFLTMPSPNMRPSAEIYPRGLEQVIIAKKLGFGRVWLAEHHFSTYSYVCSPPTFLAYLAAKTSTIRLGTAITPVPLHIPLLAAEQMATLDVLSNGRVEVGLGKGYQR